MGRMTDAIWQHLATLAVTRRSVANDRRAPRKAAADAFYQHMLAALDAAVAHGDVERERNRCRRRIAMLANSHDHALERHMKLLRRAFHDADVGLMGNQPVDIAGR